MRKLIDGTIVEELEEAKTFSITTKCPAKWILVDKETAEAYTPYETEGSLQWKKIHPKDTNA